MHDNSQPITKEEAIREEEANASSVPSSERNVAIKTSLKAGGRWIRGSEAELE